MNDCSGVGDGLTVNGNGDGQTLTRPNRGWIERGAETSQTGTNKGGGAYGAKQRQWKVKPKEIRHAGGNKPNQ